MVDGHFLRWLSGAAGNTAQLVQLFCSLQRKHILSFWRFGRGIDDRLHDGDAL